MAEQIGFVGLGIMGGPMSQNMAKKFPVLGFDVSPARRSAVTGISPAAGIAEVAAACSVIFLSLPSAAVVEEVALGPSGLEQTMKRGSLLVDLSTSLPSVSRRIAGRLASRGIDFADAPVSGGEKGAKEAGLAIMVGASAAVFQRCRPFLAAIGKTAVRVGDVGAGGIAKLVNNMIVASTFAVIAEGIALAVKNGVGVEDLYQSIREGWAGSKVLDVSAADIASRRYAPGGTVDMMQKDLSYARLLAAESHSPIPMTAAAHELFVAGQAAGLGTSSQPAIFELFSRTGGAGR